jgi:hypothetical protein
MNDEQIKQRIKYLVEHGGLWDDPLEDIRKQLRRLWWVAGVGSVGVSGITLALFLLH